MSVYLTASPNALLLAELLHGALGRAPTGAELMAAANAMLNLIEYRDSGDQALYDAGTELHAMAKELQAHGL